MMPIIKGQAKSILDFIQSKSLVCHNSGEPSADRLTKNQSGLQQKSFNYWQCLIECYRICILPIESEKLMHMIYYI